MEKKNNLPNSWAVYNDGSQLFKDIVLNYINSTLRVEDCMRGDRTDWYTFDKSCGFNVYAGIDKSQYTELTIPEFIELSKPIDEMDGPYDSQFRPYEYADKLMAGKTTGKDNGEWVPEYGEKVTVGMLGDKKIEAIFLAKVPNGYICQGINSFKTDVVDTINIFKVVSKIKPSYTIEEIADKLGHKPGEFTIAGLYGS